jgi:DNA-binding beta-propeller fold protein YncE
MYGFAVSVSSLIDRFNLISAVAPMRYDSQPSEIAADPHFVDPDLAIKAHVTVTTDDPQFVLHHDVSNVPGAIGSGVEISSPGPVAGTFGQLFTFNNPNSSALDRGIDPRFDSIGFIPLAGAYGDTGLDARTFFDLGSGFGIITGFYNLRTFARNAAGDLTGSSSYSISATFDPAGGIHEIDLPLLTDGLALNPDTGVAVVPVGGTGLISQIKGISLVDLEQKRVRRTIFIDDLSFDACINAATNTAVVAGMTPSLSQFRGHVYIVDLGTESLRATIPFDSFAPTSAACNPVTNQALIGGQSPRAPPNAKAAAAVVDLATSQVVAAFEFPAPSYMLYTGGVAINVKTNTGIALTNTGNGGGEGRLHLIDLDAYVLADGAIALTAEGNRVIANAATNQALVTVTGQLRPREPGSLTIADLNTGQITSSIPIGSLGGVARPVGLDLQPETNIALVAEVSEAKIAVIDLTAETVVFSVRLPGAFINNRNAVAFYPRANAAVATLSQEVQVFQVPR